MESPKSELRERDAHRLGRSDPHGPWPGSPVRYLSPGERRTLPGHPQLRPVRQGTRVPGRLSERLAAGWSPTPRRRPRLHQPVPELGKSSIRRSGSRRATPARAWIRAEPGALRTIDHFSPRETGISYDCIEWAGAQTWSSGKVGLNGHFLLRHQSVARRFACGRGISPRCASGRARPDCTAT